MAQSKEKLKEIVERLEIERDELKVKLSLAKLEARDEWDELEKKMDTLRGRMKVIGGEAGEMSGEVAAAAGALADEVKKGLSRIRKLI